MTPYNGKMILQFDIVELGFDTSDLLCDVRMAGKQYDLPFLR